MFTVLRRAEDEDAVAGRDRPGHKRHEPVAVPRAQGRGLNDKRLIGYYYYHHHHHHHHHHYYY